MSKVIKGGTIVTADLTYQADVLIEHGRIAAIGSNMKGCEVMFHTLVKTKGPDQ
jgi:dihydropyrimidinase